MVTDLRQLGAKPTAAPVKGLGCFRAEIEWLAPKNFLATTPFERLQHLPRYFKALLVRADRAVLAPAKDVEKARQVQPYLQACRI